MLDHVVNQLRSMTLFITHYQTLAKIAERTHGALKNVHMSFTEQDSDTGEKTVTFLYEVAEGVAHRSYGLNVAKLAGLPAKPLLEEAERRSKDMEEQEGRRRLNYLSAIVRSIAAGGTAEDVEHLVAGLEQMQ